MRGLRETLRLHALWVRGEDGGSPADLRYADLRGADLCHTDLCGADLRDTDLRGADLRDTNLCGADLRYADLRGTDLGDTDLRGADLRGADLRDTDLRDTDLRGTDLGDTDLRRTDLCGADLCGADLCGADLRDTDLGGTDLRGARLWNTVIDPLCRGNGDVAGFERDGLLHVIGYRSADSPAMGSDSYEVGRAYTAPVFSVCSTDCHPGLYLSPSVNVAVAWHVNNGWCRPELLVKVRALTRDVHHAGKKWRCRAFEVLAVVA